MPTAKSHKRVRKNVRWRYADEGTQERGMAVRRGGRATQFAESDGGDRGNPDVRANAADYIAKHGAAFGLKPLTSSQHRSVDPDLSKRTADAFEAMPHQPHNPRVYAAYNQFKSETIAQYNHLLKHGVTIEPWFKDGQPYTDSADMRKDVRQNKHLWFFPTVSPSQESSFGASGGELDPNENPLLERTGDTVNGYKMTVNDLFRAVHDYYGHAKEGHQFGPEGEYNAWAEHAKMFSPLARQAMTTETHGQNSWVNFGKHIRRPDGSIPNRNDPDYIPQTKRPFADQKVNILPPDAVPPLDEPEAKKMSRSTGHRFIAALADVARFALRAGEKKLHLPSEQELPGGVPLPATHLEHVLRRDPVKDTPIEFTAHTDIGAKRKDSEGNPNPWKRITKLAQVRGLLGVDYPTRAKALNPNWAPKGNWIQKNLDIHGRSTPTGLHEDGRPYIRVLPIENVVEPIYYGHRYTEGDQVSDAERKPVRISKEEAMRFKAPKEEDPSVVPLRVYDFNGIHHVLFKGKHYRIKHDEATPQSAPVQQPPTSEAPPAAEQAPPAEPTAPPPVTRPPHWSDTLGVRPDATDAEIEAAYRNKARTAHPDRGGSAEQMNELQHAIEAARLRDKPIPFAPPYRGPAPASEEQPYPEPQPQPQPKPEPEPMPEPAPMPQPTPQPEEQPEPQPHATAAEAIRRAADPAKLLENVHNMWHGLPETKDGSPKWNQKVQGMHAGDFAIRELEDAAKRGVNVDKWLADSGIADPRLYQIKPVPPVAPFEYKQPASAAGPAVSGASENASPPPAGPAAPTAAEPFPQPNVVNYKPGMEPPTEAPPFAEPADEHPPWADMVRNLPPLRQKAVGLIRSLIAGIKHGAALAYQTVKEDREKGRQSAQRQQQIDADRAKAKPPLPTKTALDAANERNAKEREAAKAAQPRIGNARVYLPHETGTPRGAVMNSTKSTGYYDMRHPAAARALAQAQQNGLHVVRITEAGNPKNVVAAYVSRDPVVAKHLAEQHLKLHELWKRAKINAGSQGVDPNDKFSVWEKSPKQFEEAVGLVKHMRSILDPTGGDQRGKKPINASMAGTGIRLQKKGQPKRFALNQADHEGMLRSIAETLEPESRHARVKDWFPHLVYADWLEDNGHPAVAEVIRHTHAQSQTPEWTGMGRLYPDQPMPNGLAFDTQDHWAKPQTAFVTIHSPDPTTPGQRLMWHATLPKPSADKLVQGLRDEGIPDANQPEHPHQMSNANTPARFTAAASPSTAQSIAQVNSANQSKLKEIAGQILQQFGLQPHKLVNAIADSQSASQPGVAQQIMKPVSPEHIRRAAAQYGLLAGQKNLLVFHAHPEGKDSLYGIDMPGGDDTRRMLDSFGLHSRVLVPNATGFRALIHDPGRQLRPKVAQLANSIGANVDETVGTGEHLGAKEPINAAT